MAWVVDFSFFSLVILSLSENLQCCDSSFNRERWRRRRFGAPSLSLTYSVIRLL